jgi:hypothetical protein
MKKYFPSNDTRRLQKSDGLYTVFIWFRNKILRQLEETTMQNLSINRNTRVSLFGNFFTTVLTSVVEPEPEP